MDRPRQPAFGFRALGRRSGDIIKDLGFPAILRPSFTMGGSGGDIIYSPEESNAR